MSFDFGEADFGSTSRAFALDKLLEEPRKAHNGVSSSEGGEIYMSPHSINEDAQTGPVSTSPKFPSLSSSPLSTHVNNPFLPQSLPYTNASFPESNDITSNGGPFGFSPPVLSEEETSHSPLFTHSQQDNHTHTGEATHAQTQGDNTPTPTQTEKKITGQTEMFNGSFVGSHSSTIHTSSTSVHVPALYEQASHTGGLNGSKQTPSAHSKTGASSPSQAYIEWEVQHLKDIKEAQDAEIEEQNALKIQAKEELNQWVSEREHMLKEIAHKTQNNALKQQTHTPNKNTQQQSTQLNWNTIAALIQKTQNTQTQKDTSKMKKLIMDMQTLSTN